MLFNHLTWALRNSKNIVLGSNWIKAQGSVEIYLQNNTKRPKKSSKSELRKCHNVNYLHVSPDWYNKADQYLEYTFSVMHVRGCEARWTTNRLHKSTKNQNQETTAWPIKRSSVRCIWTYLWEPEQNRQQ